MKFKQYIESYLIEQCEPYTLIESAYQVKMRKPEKYKKVNPKTNRIKTFRKTRYVATKIAPGKRTLDNMPKYADGKSKVSFHDWLELKGGSLGFGKAADGKWYGWSHRAIYGFKAGDKVKGDNLGKKVTYPKYTAADVKAAELAADGEITVIPVAGETNWDAGNYEPDFTIKNDDHAQEVAKTFHGNVS